MPATESNTRATATERGRTAPWPDGHGDGSEPGYPGALHDERDIDYDLLTPQYPDPGHGGGPSRPQRFAARIHDRLPPTLQGQWRLDRRAAAVLATAVFALALALSGWTLLRSTPHPIEFPLSTGLPVGDAAAAHSSHRHADPMPPSDGEGRGGTGFGTETTQDTAPYPPRPSGSAGAGGAAPLALASGILIDVEGRVANPGVVRLPAGARVLDALHAAGGALPGTDLAPLNQARILNDGEQVFVAAPGQSAGSSAGAAASPTPGAAKSRGKVPLAGPIRLNTATLEQLEQLPGVGPALAQRVLDWRTAHGQFSSIGQLHQVKGFGPAKFAAVSGLVTP
jgi:competence protein ComEA